VTDSSANIADDASLSSLDDAEFNSLDDARKRAYIEYLLKLFEEDINHLAKQRTSLRDYIAELVVTVRILERISISLIALAALSTITALFGAWGVIPLFQFTPYFSAFMAVGSFLIYQRRLAMRYPARIKTYSNLVSRHTEEHHRLTLAKGVICPEETTSADGKYEFFIYEKLRVCVAILIKVRKKLDDETSDLGIKDISGSKL